MSERRKRSFAGRSELVQDGEEDIYEGAAGDEVVLRAMVPSLVHPGLIVKRLEKEKKLPTKTKKQFLSSSLLTTTSRGRTADE